MGIPKLYGFHSIDDTASALRSYIVQCQNAALQRHSSFKLVVSGGSLPPTLARGLLAQPSGGHDQLDFSKWEIFFADERVVPLDHEDSNYRLLKDELLDKIPSTLPKPIVHSIDINYIDDPQKMADLYQEEISRSVAAEDGFPIFDLLLLGCGLDGHTCSLFPNHRLLLEKNAWVAEITDSPKHPSKRVTLTMPVITHGVKIAFVVTGAEKREIMKKIFDTDEGKSLPCGFINRIRGDKVSWFTDSKAIEGIYFSQG